MKFNPSKNQLYGRPIAVPELFGRPIHENKIMKKLKISHLWNLSTSKKSTMWYKLDATVCVIFNLTIVITALKYTDYSLFHN